MIDVPTAVRRKAIVAGAHGWLDRLPDIIRGLEDDWGISVGPTFGDATEAVVAAASLADGTPAVLKLVVPGDALRHEITALRLARGHGCVRLLRDDLDAGALLLERLGPSLRRLGLPLARRLGILCDAASQVWRPAAGAGLPTGADKGRWLVDLVTRDWDELDRPCSLRAVEHAIACAERRIAAHDDARAVLVHGDVHQWNALQASDGFRLVDPDGLLAEAEYDLGILMREDPLELLADPDPADRARWLADRTGLDAAAIWEWGAIERVSTGLIATRIGLQPAGRQMLAAADLVVGRQP